MRVDGKTVAMNWDGTYSFIAQKNAYTVGGTFAKKVFQDSTNEYTLWNLNRQNEGTQTLTNGRIGTKGVVSAFAEQAATLGNYTALSFKDMYTNLDMTLNIKDALAVDFAFADGQNVGFCVTEANGNVYLKTMASGLLGETTIYTFSAAEKEKYATEGVDWRIIRDGKQFSFRIDGEVRGNVVDLGNAVAVDTEAIVKLIHYGATGKWTDIAFAVTGETVTIFDGWKTEDLCWDTTKQSFDILSLDASECSNAAHAIYVKNGAAFHDVDFAIKVKEEGSSKVMLELKFGDKNLWYDSIAEIMLQSENGESFITLRTRDTGKQVCRIYTLTAAEATKYQAEGVNLRLVREGLKISLYLDGKKCMLTDTTYNVCRSGDIVLQEGQYIKANSAVSLVLNYYHDAGAQVDFPYELYVEEGSLGKDVENDASVFYTNSKKTGIADPFVLDNTARDGYYYMYGTQGVCYCYRSKNLMDWEAVGNAFDNNNEPAKSVIHKDIWAPEVVYDNGWYYMFFSATPAVDENNLENNAKEVLFVAKSRCPYKDFILVDFTDESSCGTGNTNPYTVHGIYKHYYTKYFLLDPATYAQKSGKSYEEYYYLKAIDPHPYVDTDGTKYLFWVDSAYEDCICGVKMTNWLKPDWSTFTVLTYARYYTTDKTSTVPYENADIAINDGPTVTKYGDRYYLTFSVNSYKNSSYQVIQAVTGANATSPLAKYTKLTEEKGGLLLSSTAAASEKVSGAGHHTFVTVGDQMYIIYHRHNDSVVQGPARNHAIDEVKWVKNSDGVDVMYVNGPTSTIQPKIEKYSDYKNIATEATLQGGASDAKYLTDGLLSIKSKATHAQSLETVISSNTTYTFNFASARTVRGIMVYNSKNASTAFVNARVEYVCEENDNQVTYTETLSFDESASHTEPGAAAYAKLRGYNVVSVKVTVEVPAGQSQVGISEIKILGR